MPPHPVTLLTIGRAVDKKGFDDLLHALAQLPRELHWRLVHIGGGTAAREARGARAHARPRRADRMARARRRMPTVLDAYRDADVFVLPWRVSDDGDRDGLPNVLLEAQSQRVACVSTRVSGIPELIVDGVTGVLVEPRVAGCARAGAVTADRRPAAAPFARRRRARANDDAILAARRRRSARGTIRRKRRAMRVAFYAPLKSADHPVPSGDRHLARALLRALDHAGHEGIVASRFRSFDRSGDPARQARLQRLGERIAQRLIARWRDGRPPDVWFTYHLYHKAPDVSARQSLGRCAFRMSSPRRRSRRASAMARGRAATRWPSMRCAPPTRSSVSIHATCRRSAARVESTHP